jgi:hypothetical protein
VQVVVAALEAQVVVAVQAVQAVRLVHVLAVAVAVAAHLQGSSQLLPAALVEMVIALLVAGRLLVRQVVVVVALAEQVVGREQREAQGCREFRLLVLVEQVEQQVLLVEQALQVLQALRALQAQQDQSGRMYKVTLMLRGLTLEQEMEQHHD